MYIIEVCSGVRKEAIIKTVEPSDFALLTKKQYSFNWKSLKKSTTIYKLTIEGEKDILGVMALIDYPEEKRIEIKLLASSLENQGRKKKYERIAGCMIAFACDLAGKKYHEEACVSLVPKTTLLNHYKQKYYMAWNGRQLFLEYASLNKLLNEYFP
ncbi:hypothetical protein [Niastella sp. OAS944]|uniref:hypothetical protein n=1 Tax=Niastella sp. OAS944 TaxID=2664089 RepID=UPI00346979E7|nr:hypothetical protein [Chitinophagaceae bacterium OAS944]